jgi:hypothetical protein
VDHKKIGYAGVANGCICLRMEKEWLALLVKVINFCFNQMREELLDQLSNCTNFDHPSVMYVQCDLPNGINSM